LTYKTRPYQVGNAFLFFFLSFWFTFIPFCT